jgi:hypothetical protein
MPSTDRHLKGGSPFLTDFTGDADRSEVRGEQRADFLRR